MKLSNTGETSKDMGYSTVCFDSLSFTSNVDLSCEIEDEIFESLDEEKKERKPLIRGSGADADKLACDIFFETVTKDKEEGK